MGCLISLILLGISAGIIFLWGVSKATIIILIALWAVGFIFTFIFGHRGFGTGNNTDLMILIFVFGISLAIAVPYFHKQQQKVFCEQTKKALVEISGAEKDYFSKHKSFTGDINALNLKWIQGVNISIKADETSFVATASHNECDMDNDKVLINSLGIQKKAAFNKQHASFYFFALSKKSKMFLISLPALSTDLK